MLSALLETGDAVWEQLMMMALWKKQSALHACTALQQSLH
jgi:hypothetical protein